MSVCFLHIYDVTNTGNESTNVAIARFNAVGRYAGIGLFHGGLEVNGTEWSFGCCEKGSGVYCCKPRDNPMYAYRETVTLGATTLSEYQVKQAIAELRERWQGKEYDILTRNCNHFCQDFAKRLGVSDIPGWLNRVAGGVEMVSQFSAQTADQMRWLHSSAATWLNSWSQPNPAADPKTSPSKSSPEKKRQEESKG